MSEHANLHKANKPDVPKVPTPKSTPKSTQKANAKPKPTPKPTANAASPVIQVPVRAEPPSGMPSLDLDQMNLCTASSRSTTPTSMAGTPTGMPSAPWPVDMATARIDAASEDQHRAQVAAGVSCLGSWSHHTEWVKAIAVLPEGLIASGGWDNNITLWDQQQGVQRVLTGHTHWVQALIGLDDHNSLVSASFDGSIKIWDLATGNCNLTLADHCGPVLGLAKLPGGLFASSSWDRTVRVWSPQGASVSELLGHTGRVRCLCSVGSELIASGDDSCVVRLWNMQGTRLWTVLTGHEAAVWAVCELDVTRPGAVLATGSCDNTIKLWSRERCLTTLHGHSGYVVTLCMVNGLLCSGSFDKTIRVWGLKQGEQKFVFRQHVESVLTLQPCNGKLVSGSCDKTVKMFGPFDQIVE